MSFRHNISACFAAVLGLVLLLSASNPCKAANLQITAKLDSAYIIMGQKTNLNLQVVKDRKIPGHCPMFAEENNLPYVTLNGDTIELSRNFTADTVDLGSNRSQITYHIPVQAFDSGFYYLPPIKYVAGADTAESNRVPLKVLPVNATAKDEISGMTDVANPEDSSWLDKVPDAIYHYWWLILLIIALAVLLFVYWRKYSKSGKSLLPGKKILSPYQEAVEALKKLKGKKLWQTGQDDEYFTELTDILRRYISRRFGVAAPEMTSTQFLAAAGSNEKLSPYKADLQELLSIADYVKFANAKSLPDENEHAYDVTLRFIETTRPSKEEEQAIKESEGQQQEKATITSTKIKRQAARRKNQTAGNSNKKSNPGKRTSGKKRANRGKEVKK